MRIFGKQTVAETDKNTFTTFFQFREDQIIVEFHMDHDGNIEHLTIGDSSNRRVEISEIGQYAELLIDIEMFIARYHAKLREIT